MQMATHSLIAADLISEQLVVGHDLFRSQKGNRVSYPQHHADEVVDIVIIVQAAQALQRSDLKMVSTVLFKITTHTHTQTHTHLGCVRIGRDERLLSREPVRVAKVEAKENLIRMMCGRCC